MNFRFFYTFKNTITYSTIIACISVQKVTFQRVPTFILFCSNYFYFLKLFQVFRKIRIFTFRQDPVTLDRNASQIIQVNRKIFLFPKENLSTVPNNFLLVIVQFLERHRMVFLLAPFPNHFPQIGRNLIKNMLAYNSTVLITPSSKNWVQLCNNVKRRPFSSFFQHGFNFILNPLHATFARLDKKLKLLAFFVRRLQTKVPTQLVKTCFHMSQAGFFSCSEIARVQRETLSTQVECTF